MDSKTIEKIQAQVSNEKELIDQLNSYESMFNMEWKLPDAWEAKDWVRKEVSTDAHDAIRTATNIYDTNNPKWQILPRGGIADKDSAEELETVLEWWMQRANKIGDTEPFRKSLHNSCLQNYVIYQLDYLPYWLPKDKTKWTKAQKAAMKASSFCVNVLDKRNFFYEKGKYVLNWGATVTVASAQEIINHWEVYENDNEEGKQIKSALSKIRKELDKDEDLTYILVDFSSFDKREVSAFPTTSQSLSDFENFDSESKDKIDILDVENKLGFINYVVIKGESTPLLYSMHKAGLWENQNLLDTIIHSTTMRRAVFPILKHTSPTGKELDIDYKGEQDKIELVNGEEVEILVPPPIDPAMASLSISNTGKSAQATGIKGLASIEIEGNVQYAAVQAVINLHKTSLIPYVRTVEKANSQLGDMAFMWLKEGDGYTEIAYRTKEKGNGKQEGMGITITPDDFDPDDLFISCKLIANTTTDKQTEANFYAQLKQAGAHIAWKEVLENLSLGDGDVLEAEWIDEEIQTIALQQKVKELDALLQDMMKQKDFERQTQAQQQQQEQAAALEAQKGQVQPPQGDPMNQGGQGMNTGQGGMSTAIANPGATSPVQ